VLGVIVLRKGYYWIGGYLISRRKDSTLEQGREYVTHVILTVADHFEPSRSEGKAGERRVQEWCDKYREIAGRHLDSDGRCFQHTWFYRYDYPNSECLRTLASACYDGFGEIEFHLHHGYDTPSGFSEKLDHGLTWFNSAGAMLTTEEKPKRTFAYIAGNWALDNGRGDPAFSGVNTELQILGRYGCFADFTFPAYGENSQPGKVNSIYYAAGTPKPKSYNTGLDMAVGIKNEGDLLIFQGPLYVDWKAGFVEHAALETAHPYHQERSKYWLNAHVHVRGRPEWTFVKLHTHGMQSQEMFLSSQIEQMLNDVETMCSGPTYQLHYVTAREAYNIARAAEAGYEGNPDDYRDYEIPPPVNRFVYCNRPYTVNLFANDHVQIQFNSTQPGTELRINRSINVEISEADSLQSVELILRDPDEVYLNIRGSGQCNLLVRTETQELIVRDTVDLPCQRAISIQPN